MARQNSVQLMTKGNIAKQIVGYAIPLFIGYLFQQLYNRRLGLKMKIELLKQCIRRLLLEFF